MLILVGVLAVSVGLAVDAPVARAEEPEAAVSDDVAAELATNGEADVIVALRTAIPLSSNEDPSAASARRSSMGRAAQAFVDQLPEEIERPTGAARPSRFVNLHLDAAGVDTLRTSPWVRAIVPNEQRKLSLAKSAPAIGAPIAWESGYTGSGSAIAIIDSGMQTNHPFLAGRVIGEACFSGGSTSQAVSSLCPGGVDFDEGPGAGGPCSMPDCIHGTHVAGIAAGADGPNSAPSGVAPGANLVSVMAASRITGQQYCGDGVPTCLSLLDFDVLSALDWVGANQSTYDIVAANMSFGGGSFGGNCDVFSDESNPLYWYTLFFEAYRDVGIAPVVASGNAEQSQAMSAPACISSALSVGAIATSNLQVPFWSNSSPTLDFLAPGTDVELAGSAFGIRSSVPTSTYAQIPGTSMAAPHVAGAIAVLQAANPGLSVDFAELVLKLTGRPIVDGRQGRSTPLIQLDEAIPKPKGTYHPVNPARLLDTRNGTGAPQAKVGAGKSIDLQVGGRGGVPTSGVSAVVLNVTYVLPSSFGFVTVWPKGALRPTASNLNLNPGDARPNLVTVRMGADGKVSLYNAAGTVDLIADVAGWYDQEPTNNGGYYHATSPTRVLDTRIGKGAPAQKVGPGGKLTIDVTDVSPTLSSIPAGATAAVVNLVGTGATAGTHVTAYPADLPNPPVASNLNISPGQTRPNLVIVPVDVNGNLTLYNNAGAIDLIADIQGWYDGTPGYRFVPKSPSRILDTRINLGKSGALGAGQSFALQVTGRGNVPTTDVAGVVMNLTSTGVNVGGFVTVYPDGVTLPTASNLNLEIGKDVPNLVASALPGNGRARIYNAVGSVHLIGDVAGWFTT